jgi:hypothetical protein
MKKQLLFLVCAVYLLTGCAVVDRMSGVSHARDIQKRGVEAEATILRVWDTGMTVNDDPVVGLLLEVRPTGTAVYQAETKALISRIDVPQFQPGHVIPVKYDPNDPKQVAVNVYEY